MVWGGGVNLLRNLENYETWVTAAVGYLVIVFQSQKTG